MKAIPIAALFVSIILLSGCEELIKDMVQEAMIKGTAEKYGKFPPCPTERPYRLGTMLLGPCVDEATLDEYVKLKRDASTTEDEKDFIVSEKAKLLAIAEGCPQGRPYAIRKWFFGTVCLTELEFSDIISDEISDLEEEEKAEGKERFISGSAFCKAGELFDSHMQVCVNPNDCNNYPNMVFNMQTGLCDCMEGYVTAEEGCEKEVAVRNCQYDSECGKPYCEAGTSRKKVPRCDARSYTCWTEVVDCKEFFGEKATCEAGLCKSG